MSEKRGCRPAGNGLRLNSEDRRVRQDGKSSRDASDSIESAAHRKKTDPVVASLIGQHDREERGETPTRYEAPDKADKMQGLYAITMMKLSNGERAVAGCLIWHANQRTGRCDPSVARISRLTRLDVATVHRALAGLTAKHLIRRDARRSGNRRFQSTSACHLNWAAFREWFSAWEEQAKRRSSASQSCVSASQACDPSVSQSCAGQPRNSAPVSLANLHRSASQDCDPNPLKREPIEGRTHEAGTHEGEPIERQPIGRNCASLRSARGRSDSDSLAPVENPSPTSPPRERLPQHDRWYVPEGTRTTGGTVPAGMPDEIPFDVEPAAPDDPVSFDGPSIGLYGLDDLSEPRRPARSRLTPRAASTSGRKAPPEWVGSREGYERRIALLLGGNNAAWTRAILHDDPEDAVKRAKRLLCTELKPNDRWLLESFIAEREGTAA